jgi:hypothetical protein
MCRATLESDLSAGPGDDAPGRVIKALPSLFPEPDCIVDNAINSCLNKAYSITNSLSLGYGGAPYDNGVSVAVLGKGCLSEVRENSFH